MRWIAPCGKDTASATLEKRLWDAADQFRANSGLKAQEYSGPILGLIFLRFAEARFAALRDKLEAAGSSSRRGCRVDDPAAYQAEGVLYLAPEARYDALLALPEVADIGAKLNDAMRAIEKHNPQLAGVLPKTYYLFTPTLLKDLLKKVSEIPVSLDFDAFSRIYEYFLGEFAMSEGQGQGGGEFYTPSSIVKLLTEVIEPFHGRILDPACGSGGMFVRSARFVAEHQKNPAAELAVCGVEKTDETGRLCRLNLAVHGLEGDIRHGGNVNSYYDDPHTPTGAFDFVLANPPFNVNAVDKGGWEVKKLGKIAEEVRRSVPKGLLEDPAPFVGLEHIPRRSLALDAWESTTELGSNKLEFRKGEVLFGKIRPYSHKVSVAPFDGLCSADTIVIRSRRPEHYAMVVGCDSSDDFVALATATSNGSKMPRANWTVLAEHQVAIPPSTVARLFTVIIEPAIAQMQTLVFQVENLRRTRDLLLPRLLSGQIALDELEAA
jgi:type I restriction enzyme M protein